LAHSAPHLEFAGLRAGYGGPDILTGVDLKIYAAEFVCILGPNGAGKSTLLQTLFGMTTLTGGSITLMGVDIGIPRPLRMQELGIAFVPQGRCNFPEMSVAENLEMAGYRRGDKAGLRRDLDYVKSRFPMLAEKRAAMASALSGGQQQILELAMALMQRPKLLLIDEPSMGLSPSAAAMVFEELLRLRSEGLTILLVEQNTKRALQVASRAVILRLGQVLWHGPSAALSHDHLAEMFLTGKVNFELDGTSEN
jgi:branched-chain amino acid transport system ATP-binding protein